MNGPSWLNTPENWPEQIDAKPTDVAESESRLIRTVMKTTLQGILYFVDDLLERASTVEKSTGPSMDQEI